MNEENIKLAKVKKSCKALRIVTRIVAIACIVGCVLATVSGLAIMLSGQKFDDAMIKAMASIAVLLTRAKVLFILLSLLKSHTISNMMNAAANAAMRAGTGRTGFKFLILFSLQKQKTYL